MNVTIVETKERKSLNITDPKTGMDWTNDLMGNYDGLPEYDEETDSYLMTTDDYKWWADLIARYQEADDRYYEIAKELDPAEREEFEDIVASHCSVDLENHPEALQQACDEWEKINE